jgi:hypothetical protein
MPRINDQFLDCVFYLYPSAEAAAARERKGGCGFFVGVRLAAGSDQFHVYAVTNRHVIAEGSSPVIVMNRRDGGTEILPLKRGNWLMDPSGNDLAAAPLGRLDIDRLKMRFLTTEQFITPNLIKEYEVGPGDETFMVGRFAPHDGGRRNLPSVRFGNVSMMPDEPVTTPLGLKQESFLVETRSLAGYSGSPVFIHFLQGAPRPKEQNMGLVVRPTIGPFLLGVDWGHLNIVEKVKDADGETDVRNESTGERLGWVVKSNSGQMAVVPAWRLEDLLTSDELRALRIEVTGQ